MVEKDDESFPAPVRIVVLSTQLLVRWKFHIV